MIDLNYKKFASMLKQMPRVQFSAITVSPAGEQALLSTTLSEPTIFGSSNDIFRITRLRVGSLDIYPVQKQITEYIHWTSKSALFTYLEMMGERETTQYSRLNALTLIAASSSLEFGDVVVKTMNISTEHLDAAAKLLPPVPVTMPPAKFAELLNLPFAEPKEKQQTRREPFYAKFVSKRRR